MGIFDRLTTMIRSNLNDLISRAENPEKMLNQLVLDMRSQLAKAKQQVAGAIADEKRLQAQAEQEKKLAEDWEKRAMLAVGEGRDDLAKQALLRHAEHMQAAQQLDETWRKHAAETESLKNSLRTLNDKIEEAKRKKNILIARQRRAEAHGMLPEARRALLRLARRALAEPRGSAGRDCLPRPRRLRPRIARGLCRREAQRRAPGPGTRRQLSLSLRLSATPARPPPRPARFPAPPEMPCNRGRQ